MRGRRQGGDGTDSTIEAEPPQKSQHVQGTPHKVKTQDYSLEGIDTDKGSIINSIQSYFNERVLLRNSGGFDAKRGCVNQDHIYIRGTDQ
jgi:hypothetical protein